MHGVPSRHTHIQLVLFRSLIYVKIKTTKPNIQLLKCVTKYKKNVVPQIVISYTMEFVTTKPSTCLHSMVLRHRGDLKDDVEECLMLSERCVSSR
jgi:hypothetical protein